MTSGITFPIRKIKILNADIEVEVKLTNEEMEQLFQLIGRHDLDPIMRLTVSSPDGGKAEFTNLRFIKDEKTWYAE